MNKRILFVIILLSVVSNTIASNYKFVYFASTGTQVKDAECISTSGCSIDIDESVDIIYLFIDDSSQCFEIANKKIYKNSPYYTVSGKNNQLIYFWIHPKIVIMSTEDGDFIFTNIPKTKWDSTFFKTRISNYNK